VAKKAKEYRNVFTILDKVKKGEIDTGDQPMHRFNMSYKQRAEVVKPYLHYIDNRTLIRSVDHFIQQGSTHQELINLITKNKRLLSPTTLGPEMVKIWQKFPKEIVADIYQLLYNKVEKLEFEDRTDANKNRYQFLEKSNNPITKVITQQSNVKSMIFTRNLIQYFLAMMAVMQQEDPKAFENMMNGLNGEPGNNGQNSPGQQGQQNQQGQDPGQNSGQGNGSGDSNSPINHDLDKVLDNLMNSSMGQKAMDKVLDDAKKVSQLVDDTMTKQDQEEHWENIAHSSEEMDKLNPHKLNQLKDQLKRMKMNVNNLRDRLKNLLDKSLSYFQGKEITTYHSIFDAESLDGFQDYELLHPKMRNFSIEDVLVKEVKRQGKIDIYIDISGSMQGTCNGTGVSKLDFAKALALKMKEMDMLKDIYIFNDGVRKRKNHIHDILAISCSGGTDIDKVVYNIIRTKSNAIVLTDAEDDCKIFSEKAYFIGVSGARFTMFKHDILKQYADRKQLVIFDGQVVRTVKENGLTA